MQPIAPPVELCKIVQFLESKGHLAGDHAMVLEASKEAFDVSP